jgi:predicted TIM-barrel fold metal-dependent hydrolase
MVIDFHTHVFPGKLAPRALKTLSAKAGGLEPLYDGTPAGLEAYLRANNVDKAVVLNIATNSRQQKSVNDFAIAINSGLAWDDSAAEDGVAGNAGAAAAAAGSGADGSAGGFGAGGAAPPAVVGTVPNAAVTPNFAAGATLSAAAPVAAMPDSGGRLVAFGSVFPYAPDAMYELDRLRDAGVKGVKFHPEYQQFFVDDELIIPIYRKIARLGFITVFHAGADIGFPKPVHSEPRQFAKILPLFDGYPVVAAHMGGYLQWDDVERHLAGEDIYLDTSFMHSRIPAPQAGSIVARHGAAKILFGSDLPWSAVDGERRLVESLCLSPGDERLIMGENAERLLSGV